jgi:hypothetical protein
MTPAEDLLEKTSRIGARGDEARDLARDIEDGGAPEPGGNEPSVVGPEESVAEIGQEAGRTRVGVDAGHLGDVGRERRAEPVGEPLWDRDACRYRRCAAIRGDGEGAGRRDVLAARSAALDGGHDPGDRVAFGPLIRV